MKKYSETPPALTKCSSEHSETSAAPAAKASEASETFAAVAGKASERSETFAAPAAAASECSAAPAVATGNSCDTLPRPLATPPNLGGESQNSPSKLEEESGDSTTRCISNSTSDTLPRPLATPPNLGGESQNFTSKLEKESGDSATRCTSSSTSKLEGVPRRGEGVCKNRTHNLSATKLLRRELRTHGTAAEATMWKMLKARQVMGKQFRRQFAIGTYVLDFYCPEARLAVELDGQPHYTIEGDLHDTDRDEHLLAMHGIRTLRFENRDVFQNPEGVLEAIKEALQSSTSDTLPRPLATPPSLGGESQSSTSKLEEESGDSTTRCTSNSPSDTLPRPLATPPNLGGESQSSTSKLEEESGDSATRCISSSPSKLEGVPRRGEGVCDDPKH